MRKTRRIRIISSPKQDYLLSPSDWRRYSNQIIAYFTIILIASIFGFQLLLFPEQKNFFFSFWHAIATRNGDFLIGVNVEAVKFRSALVVAASLALSYFGTRALTKPIQRLVVKSGNFLDESDEAFDNLTRDFSNLPNHRTISLLNKGEANLLNGKECMSTVYLPAPILELSTLLIGEAGSGKTTFINRLINEILKIGHEKEEKTRKSSPKKIKHKLILHNIKGDEKRLIEGAYSMYLIEPWNQSSGWAIDFMKLLARENRHQRDAYIRIFVNAFCKATKESDFFNESAKAVLFALIKKVVEDSLCRVGGKITCTATLRDISKLWISFDLPDIPEEATRRDDIAAAFMNQSAISVDRIKALLLEKNPTQASLIDSTNPKTSMCILATCTNTIQKFELLSNFWGEKEKTKAIDLIEWINNPNDRQVLMLSNSLLYSSEAEAYISATVNLLVTFLINQEYQPKTQIHFMLDEFVQLTSINLNQVLRLPDVGRSKDIRFFVGFQRLDQIKQVFGSESMNFIGAFANKIFARPSTSDLETLSSVLGKTTVSEYQATSNSNAQGISSSLRVVDKENPVCNPHDLQNKLGPFFTKRTAFSEPKFLGVKLLFKFNQIDRVCILAFPPVTFQKRSKLKEVPREGVALGGVANPAKQSTEEQAKANDWLEKTSQTEQLITEHNEPLEAGKDEPSPLGEALADIAVHAAAEPLLGTAMTVAQLADALTEPSSNANVTTVVVTDERKERILKLLNKNKNRELER